MLGLSFKEFLAVVALSSSCCLAGVLLTSIFTQDVRWLTADAFATALFGVPVFRHLILERARWLTIVRDQEKRLR